MMDWEEKRVLFYMYSKPMGLERHVVQQLAYAGAKDTGDANDLILNLLAKGYIVKELRNFRLTELGTAEVEEMWHKVKSVMIEIGKLLTKHFSNITSINVGDTGVHFTYGPKLYMFRFNAIEVQSELMIDVGFPVLFRSEGSIEMNSMLIRPDLIIRDSFLIDLVGLYISLIESDNHA